MSILAFNGPYGFKESAKFITFEMIEKVVQEERPSLVIINGPFFNNRSQSSETGNYTAQINGSDEKKIFDVQSARSKQIKELIQGIQRFSPETQIQILPDIEEFDCFFPLPIPNNAIEKSIFDSNNQRVSGCSPCLMRLGEAGSGRQVRIGYIGNHALVDIMTSARLVGNVEDKVEECLKELINQHCLYPTTSKHRPFDITKIADICYSTQDAPDVLFISSIVRNFVVVHNNTVAVTFKKSTSDTDSGFTYSRVLIDSRAMSMKPEVTFCVTLLSDEY